MSEPSPEARLWELLRGALATRALALVADLRVADALADGPRPVEDSRARSAPTPTRSAASCARSPATASSPRTEPGVFRNTAASELLLAATAGTTSPTSSAASGTAPRATLDASGEAAFPRSTAPTSGLARSAPVERAAFDRAMVQGERAARRAAGGRRLARRRDRRRRRRRQRLAARGLLAPAPGLRGIVFDLPETMRDEAALGERMEVRRGRLLRARPARRRVRPLDDPARLGRRARRRRSCARPRLRSAGRPAAHARRVVPAGKRAARRRSGSTCSCSRSSPAASGTRRSGASCSPHGGLEPVRIEDGLIEARPAARGKPMPLTALRASGSRRGPYGVEAPCP